MQVEAKVLGIQFRCNEDSIAQEQASLEREIGVYASIEFISALSDDIDWNEPESLLAQYDGVVLGGSAEFYFDGGKSEDDPQRIISQRLLQKLTPLFTYIFDHDIPTLGICYGHQLLGAFAGARVWCDSQQGKVKSHQVTLLVDKHDYFLCSDLPVTFYAHYGHRDSLDRVPEGAVLLMSGGDQCRYSVLRYKKNIYTTQFHPELTFEDMVQKMKNAPEYLPEGVLAEEIFKNDPNSNLILRNFGKFIALQDRDRKGDRKC